MESNNVGFRQQFILVWLIIYNFDLGANLMKFWATVGNSDKEEKRWLEKRVTFRNYWRRLKGTQCGKHKIHIHMKNISWNQFSFFQWDDRFIRKNLRALISRNFYKNWYFVISTLCARKKHEIKQKEKVLHKRFRSKLWFGWMYYTNKS